MNVSNADDGQHQHIGIEFVRRDQPGQEPRSRREAVRLLVGLGIGAAGLGAIGAGALATRASGAAPAIALNPHGGKHAPLLHSQGEAATPTAPTLGERPDGTRLWRVRVAGMDEENAIDLQSFFPRELTINAGDAVWFEFPTPPGFHTVTFLSGGEEPPLIVPDETAAAAPATPGADAAPPRLIINPEAAFASGGDRYDGTGYLNAGLDVLRLPDDPPFVLTFTAPGTYEYRCIPHGVVMNATIVVQAAGSPLPEDQAAADARGDAERAALVEEGLAATAQYAEATATAQADGTTLWEIAAGAGEGQARVMRFLPERLEIAAGDTVRWVNRSVSEPHTVTFLAAGGEQPEDVLVEPQADGPPTIVQNPLTLFPQGLDLAVGAGYINSGFLGELGGEPLPGGIAFERTFATPGTYPYYCILHASGPEGPGMAGTIVVS
jgi:plastocyanin